MVVVDCSLADNFTIPDSTRQFNASWHCSIVSEDQKNTYFEMTVAARFKANLILSSKISTILTSVKLLGFELVSSSPSEYQIDDPYTAKMMVGSALNASIPTVLMESEQLPIAGLNAADWDG